MCKSATILLEDILNELGVSVRLSKAMKLKDFKGARCQAERVGYDVYRIFVKSSDADDNSDIYVVDAKISNTRETALRYDGLILSFTTNRSKQFSNRKAKIASIIHEELSGSILMTVFDQDELKSHRDSLDQLIV